MLVRRRLARLRRIVVTGESMTPTLKPGEVVVVERGARVRAGGLVAIRERPDGALTVKRATERASGERWVVLGDNRVLSTDSRHFGPVPASRIEGVVRLRLSPLPRIGPIR